MIKITKLLLRNLDNMPFEFSMIAQNGGYQAFTKKWPFHCKGASSSLIVIISLGMLTGVLSMMFDIVGNEIGT